MIQYHVITVNHTAMADYRDFCGLEGNSTNRNSSWQVDD